MSDHTILDRKIQTEQRLRYLTTKLVEVYNTIKATKFKLEAANDQIEAAGYSGFFTMLAGYGRIPDEDRALFDQRSELQDELEILKLKRKRLKLKYRTELAIAQMYAGELQWTSPDRPRQQSIGALTPCGENRGESMTIQIPLVSNDTTPVEAALAYAEAGWYVLPVDRTSEGETGKNPGSVVGGNWPTASSRNPEQIREWFSSAWPPRNIALHVGRSGAIVFDHDKNELPEVLTEAIAELQPPTQSTPSGGAHYFFEQPPGRNIGNSVGSLGSGWGEVRGQNGVVIVAPSVSVGDNPKQYFWSTSGSGLKLPRLSHALATALPDAEARDRVATDRERGEFFERYTNSSNPGMLSAVVDYYRKRAFAGSRHETIVNALCWAMREARSGFYPAKTAYDLLWQEFEQTAGQDRSVVTEYEGAVDWAIGQVRAMSEAELKKQIKEAEIAVIEEEVLELEGKLLDTFQLDSLPDPRWLVQGWLELDSVARMTGKSRHGKSFVALDLAAHIGSGLEWNGHRVEQGEVIYMAAEGAFGMKKRVRAWETVNNRRMRNVYLYPEPIQTSSRYWDVLCAVAAKRRPALIVVDTQARVTVGLEENSASDMGQFVHRIEQLRQQSGACVMPVHHLGHNGKEGRGSTAVIGAVTSEIRVERLGKGEDDSEEAQTLRPVVVELVKQKNANDGLKLEFELASVEMGVDQYGDPIDSAVIKPLANFDLDAMKDRWLEAFERGDSEIDR